MGLYRDMYDIDAWPEAEAKAVTPPTQAAFLKGRGLKSMDQRADANCPPPTQQQQQQQSSLNALQQHGLHEEVHAEEGEASGSCAMAEFVNGSTDPVVCKLVEGGDGEQALLDLRARLAVMLEVDGLLV